MSSEHDDLISDLRVRHECTAGFTRDIFAPEHRDLDLKAADALSRQQQTIAELRRDAERWTTLKKFAMREYPDKQWCIGVPLYGATLDAAIDAARGERK